jgi:eukaryotic-like serine/threonine-protein kinase
MTRHPGDQGGNPPTPRDPRDPRSASGFVPGDPRGAFPGQPYAPGQLPQPGGPTVQPMHPLSGARPGHSDEETAGFQDRGHYQLAPGTQLQSGRYVIEAVVGKGGMGHVYRGRDTRLDRVRAIKEMIPQMGDPEASLINYKREARVMLDLDHPSIPEVFDTFVEGRRAYIVIQFVEGENLEQRFDRTPDFLTQEQVGEWMLQLCQIVSYLHAQKPPIIFRDIKPSNIIVTPENRIVLVDFGIAKAFHEGQEHTNVGTNGYAAKEQYMRQAEPRSDIYSIGATMHHLLTRSDPRINPPFTFAERPPRKLNPAISEAMEAVIMKAVAIEKEDRYQTTEELARAIESALGLAPVDDTSVYRATRAPARSRSSWSPALGPTGSLRQVGAEVLWATPTGDEVRATPLLTADTLYIGSYDSHFYALDRRSGAVRWKFAAGAGICGRAAIWRDLVIVGSEDANVYALNAQTGAPAWRFAASRHVRSSPRVFDDRVYVGSDDGVMYALDPRTGEKIWGYTTYREVVSSAAHARGIIYFGSRDDYVYAVDTQTGEKKWSFRTGGGVISTPWVDDDYVYVGSSDFTVYCLEAKSGWRAWEERTEKFVISSPVIAGDYLYIGSTDNHLYCLNRRTGRRQWRYRSGHQINSTPFVAGGVVYFGGIDRSVYGLDAATGALRWRFETDGMVPGSPVVDQGVVYFGSADRHVYAVRAATP